MIVKELDLKGLWLLKPELYEDERGYFYESFNKQEFFYKTGVDFNPVQDNESKSKRGVIRGLHFQKEPFAQAKLVRVIKGHIIDVAVDIRKDSETFGELIAVHLSENNKYQFFIPKGFAHGFAVLSDEVIFQYKCDEYYHPEAEGGINYNYVNWEAISYGQLKPEEFILSEKDKNREIINNIQDLKRVLGYETGD